MLLYNYTPAADATDFALAISLLDGPAEGYDAPGSDLTPVFLDIRWLGTFASFDPGSSDYYTETPVMTFTVTDEWAGETDAERDDNGVPLIELWLLDESTGDWEEVDVTYPTSGEEGIYTYTADLPHFSQYSVAADADVSSGGSGGGGASSGGSASSGTTITGHASMSVELAEALGVGGETLASQVTLVVEDLEGVLQGEASPRPSAGEPISAMDVVIRVESVSVTAQNIASSATGAVLHLIEGLLPVDFLVSSANAVLEISITNNNPQAEAVRLYFLYNDGQPSSAYNLSQLVEVGPFESRTVTAEIPFKSPGLFDVTMEAWSVSAGSMLGSTQLSVPVPWLMVYLYPLMGLAVAIVTGAATAAAMYLRGRINTKPARTTVERPRSRYRKG
jgi:hypothetical protein